MILTNKVLKRVELRNILDLSVKIDNTIDLIMRKWEYDLASSDKLGYSLDLVSFLYSLLDRNAVIIFPKYKAVTSTQNLNEKIHIIPENRHGRLISVQGNGKTFSFSVKIVDMNVMNGNKLGEVRCFKLTNSEGDWYEGLDKFQIIPSDDEEKKLRENVVLNKNNDVKFDYFIDPRKWVEFYNEDYFITKCLIERLKLESKFYYDQIKRMKSEGILPTKKEKSEKTSTIKESNKKLIKLFVSEVFHPQFVNDLPNYSSNYNNLNYLIERRNKFIYSIIPKLNFMIRAIEYAYFKVNQDIIPKEMKEKEVNIEWKKTKIKRTEWEELNLGYVGIRKRVYEKVEVI